MERRSRPAMERKKRAMKRSENENRESYMKRKMTTDTVCHFILHPVVYSTIGKSNDFFFHALRLSWNDRNIRKDPRCKQLLDGLHLDNDGIESLAVENLEISEENGWFSSSRRYDLAKIGKFGGYFLRRFACSVGKALDVDFEPEPEFNLSIGSDDLNKLTEQLKDNKTIVPAIVKVEISPHSDFVASRFVCLNENIVNILVNGHEIVIPRRVKLLEINTAFHDWAWNLLNSSETESRQQLINDFINSNIRMEVVPLETENYNQIDDVLREGVENVIDIPIDNTAVIEDIGVEWSGIGVVVEGATAIESTFGVKGILPPEDEAAGEYRKVARRRASTRLKQRSTKYPLSLFAMD